MARPLGFADWIDRWTDSEYALLRMRMNAVNFMSVGMLRHWDKALCSDTIDLDDPIMEGFLDALVREGIITQARADVIFA